MPRIQIDGFLTQAKLEAALRSLLGTGVVGREVPVGNSRKRWDLEIILAGRQCFVEFDGEGHYCVPNTIVSDEWKDRYAGACGANVIRIPYFVQLTSDTLHYLFGIDAEVEQSFPHGFIDSKAKLPAAFCSLGVARFISDLAQLPQDVSTAVWESLTHKCVSLDNRLVLPAELLSKA